MRKVDSKQVNVPFVFCPSPVTIDKRSEWGTAADNMQLAPNGAFLKLNDDASVSHLVQPNAEKTAPVGWYRPDASVPLYNKEPIFVSSYVYQAGEEVSLVLLDGPFTYDVKEPSVLCYNQNSEGSINEKDCWVQTLKNLDKNYFL